MKNAWLPMAAAMLLSACATQTTVIRADFTQGEGALIVGYATDPAVRIAIEDQLVDDLTARNMVAHPSHPDIADITTSNREQLIALARAKKAVSVLVVNQVASDASDSVVQNPARVSPNHPDLRAFYDYTEANQPVAPQVGQSVLAEVNLFIVDGDKANLFWSGTTWSFRADGQGTALRDISALVADQLQQVRTDARSTAFDR